jgi:hypothetical protein
VYLFICFLLVFTFLILFARVLIRLFLSPFAQCEAQGRGMTMDVILANGELHRGDKIMICGLKGKPILTHIRV